MRTETKILFLLQIGKRGIPKKHSQRNKLTLQDKLLHPQSTQFNNLIISCDFGHAQHQQINMFCPEGCTLKNSLS